MICVLNDIMQLIYFAHSRLYFAKLHKRSAKRASQGDRKHSTAQLSLPIIIKFRDSSMKYGCFVMHFSKFLSLVASENLLRLRNGNVLTN